jgi:hypothetical protein
MRATCAQHTRPSGCSAISPLRNSAGRRDLRGLAAPLRWCWPLSCPGVAVVFKAECATTLRLRFVVHSADGEGPRKWNSAASKDLRIRDIPFCLQANQIAIRTSTAPPHLHAHIHDLPTQARLHTHTHTHPHTHTPHTHDPPSTCAAHADCTRLASHGRDSRNSASRARQSLFVCAGGPRRMASHRLHHSPEEQP